MAPAASTAAASKRPADCDARQLAYSSSELAQGDEAARGRSQHPKQQLQCPRCRSTNTKFCYYNNYSTAQPRHFCRACRRYWTHGGTLRDVPVGGASRRAGRSKRRRLSAEPSPASPPPQTTARAEDACPDLSAFPFLSDGSFLPQFDLGVPPAAFPWPVAAVPDFHDGLALWDDGTVGAAGVTSAWGDITGLELSWPPLGN